MSIFGPDGKSFPGIHTNSWSYTPSRGGDYEWTVNYKVPSQSYYASASPYWKFKVVEPPTATPPPTPSIQTVTAFRDANYQGESVSWTGPGRYKPRDDFQMSSIVVPSGYSVRLYEHSDWTTEHGGGHTCLSESLADFARRPFDNQHQMNDRVTSLIVYSKPGCQE